jgi:peroxiredoxin
MKKYFILLALLTFLFMCTKTSKFTNLSGTITINSDVVGDSIYVGIYKSRRIGSSRYIALGKPIHFSGSTDKTFSFDVLPGCYTLAAWSFGCEAIRQQIYVPESGQTIKAEITLVTKILPETINKVQLTGEFSKYNLQNSPEMIKKGDKWYPDDKSLVQTGKNYKFIINGIYRYDLRQRKVVVSKGWSTFDNVHTGENSIIFDPSLYSQQPMTESTAEFENLPLNNQYNEMLVDLASWQENMYKARGEMKDASYDKNMELYQALTASLDSIEQKYDPQLHQRILDVKIDRLYYLHPIWSKVREHYKDGKPDTVAIKKIILGDEFGTLYNSTLTMIKKIDPTSCLLDGDFLGRVTSLEDMAEQYHELAKKYDIKDDYFYEYILDFVKKCPNKDVCAGALYHTASDYARRGKKTAKVEYLINLLKEKYADEFYVGRGHADQVLAKLKIRIGAKAPQFAVQTVDGDSLKLSDFKGQYVFIDFWGSWCGPCRGETPNLKALSKSIPSDKLAVIGLGKDDEKAFRKYIEKEKIEYPNALAGDAVLNAYGINSFPTMLLIGPDGKIVAKNIRGKGMTELVKDKMEEYDKKLKQFKAVS